MEITWLGHAAFRIRTGSTNALVDPFPSEIGLAISASQSDASVVFVSSTDPLHSAIPELPEEAMVKVVRDPGEYEVSGLYVQAIRATRNLATNQADNWNTVFSIQSENLVVWHLGNINRLLTAQEINQLSSPHILVVPVGSPEGLSPALAAETVNMVEPRIVIPMLFAHPGNKTPGLRNLNEFFSELSSKSPEPVNRLSVSRSNLPEETTPVVLMPSAPAL